MTDKNFFQTTYHRAGTQIKAEIALQAKHLAPTFPADDPLRREIMRFVAEGGKRFRPSLSLIVASFLGHDTALPHIALETFHKYILVHDDVIDRDDMRYGLPTLHAKMAERRHGHPDNQHFGNALAIIAGNVMEAATHKIILESKLPLRTKVKLEGLITRAVDEVAWGWYDQFLMDYLPLDSELLSFERIERSIVWVTGKYSVKLPLSYGYAVAGVPLPAGIEEASDTLGLLFQIGDDVMGLLGKVEDTGKSNYGDITQGKKTLPMWLAYTSATTDDKATLCKLVGKNPITQDEVIEVRRILERSGGLHRTQTLISTYRERCLEQLEGLDIPTDLRRFLRGLVYFLETRDH